MLTLGIYRFWFATDVRRYLWSNTEIGGETLEYTGLATELLGGFLLAIAIVGPLYTAIATAALALDTATAAIAAIGFLLLVLLSQFALYRARRYRLTRTVFRGVRFDQHGSAWRYAIYALLWWTLAVLTLGLAYPWAQASLQRFKMRHTSYGDLPGSFAGSGAALFWRGLPIWLVVVGPVVFAFVALGRMVDWDALNGMMAEDENNPLAVLAGSAGIDVFFVAAGALGASVVAAVLLYPLFAGDHAALVDFRPALRRGSGALAAVDGGGLSHLSALSRLRRAVSARGRGGRRPVRGLEQRTGRHRTAIPCRRNFSPAPSRSASMSLWCSAPRPFIRSRSPSRCGGSACKRPSCRGRRRSTACARPACPTPALGEGLVDALGVGGI